MCDLDVIEKEMRYRFMDERKLVRALTRHAYAQEMGLPDEDDQNAFAVLGDAVITTLVTKRLINNGGKRKGEITKDKIDFIRGEYISSAARRAGITSIIRWGKGERNQRIWENIRPLGECFEALIGAIFLDGDIDKCEHVLEVIDFFNMESIGSQNDFSYD